MGRPTAWLLNFEADLEFACAGAYTPSKALASQLGALREQHAARLLGDGDISIEPGMQFEGDEYRAVAWCPTPSALWRIQQAGLVAPPAPSFEVLAEANSRRFCASLGATLPGSLFSRDAEEITRHLLSASPPAGWLLKRNHGTSGKGQLRVTGDDIDATLQHWLQASFKQGGVSVEPLVNIQQEFAVHGWIGEQGALAIGPACMQSCSPHGTWMETRASREGECLEGEAEALVGTAHSTAEALAAIGYHGPFGVDGYRWLDEQGALQLQLRSEINARFTLGWGVGFPSTLARPWQR